MLILSRRPQQKIVLPELGITFTVLEVKTNRVQIGIEAPREFDVHREEVLEAHASRGYSEAFFGTSSLQHGESGLNEQPKLTPSAEFRRIPR